MSVTLCLTYFSHHVLKETEADEYMEDEPQNMPCPPTAFHSWNVLGALRAYLQHWVLGPLSTSFALKVSETLVELAKEQVC